MKWEYASVSEGMGGDRNRYVWINTPSDQTSEKAKGGALLPAINKLGNEGWEAVGISSYLDSDGWAFQKILLKRAK